MQKCFLLVVYVAVMVVAPSRAIQCSQTAIKKACALKNNANLRLASAHVSGKKDRGFALKNIQDMCSGNGAYTSNYCTDCKGKSLPENSVCISENLLDFLADAAKNGHVTVNEIAGGCHKCTSLHYKGMAVDLDIKRKMYYKTSCEKFHGEYIDESKTNHIHCEF